MPHYYTFFVAKLTKLWKLYLEIIIKMFLLSYLDAKKLNPSYKVVIFDYQFCNNIRKDRDLWNMPILGKTKTKTELSALDSA